MNECEELFMCKDAMQGVVQLSSKILVKIMEQHVAVQCITLYLLFPFKKMCLIFKG